MKTVNTAAVGLGSRPKLPPLRPPPHQLGEPPPHQRRQVDPAPARCRVASPVYDVHPASRHQPLEPSGLVDGGEGAPRVGTLGRWLASLRTPFALEFSPDALPQHVKITKFICR